MSLKDKLFSFDGRMRRRDWWVASLGLFILASIVSEVSIGLLFGGAYTAVVGGLEAYALRVDRIDVLAVHHLVSLITFWPAFAMASKRAHDRGRSARTVIVVMSASVVLSYAVAYVRIVTLHDVTSLPMLGGYLAYSLISFALSLYLFVVVGCLDGTPGPNRFGPSPKGLGGAPAID